MNPFRLPSSSLLAGLCLYLVLGLCVYIYWPGLSGPFLFDDFVNLEPLGYHYRVNDLRSFFQFVTSGIAGPTGRPISLLSFLLNDVTWPSEPWSFKYTNLLIHLLNGVLVYWVSLRVLRLNGRHFIHHQAEWLALASASLWLLHPMLVSTTLYVIQRMTLLATFFSLLGLLLYLQGREKMQSNLRLGYGLITLAVTAFTVLAVLSKESGAVLPLLLAVVEFTVLRQQNRIIRHPNNIWNLIFFGLPALAIVIYLSRYLMPQYANIFAARNYTAFQRGLTESRVIMHYLYDLLIPKLYEGSLFNDDFPVSSGLLSPPTTALSFALIVSLLSVAVLVRQSYNLVSLSILFFLVGHILESTVAPLDLYYEHRNYLPSIFLFLPLAYSAEFRVKQTGFAVLIALLIFSFFTAAKAKLWSNEADLLLFWGKQHPNSPRAQRDASNIYFERGEIGKALQILDEATTKHPENIKLRLHRMTFACTIDKPDMGYWNHTLSLIEHSPIYVDGQILENLNLLVRLTGNNQCQWLTFERFNEMADKILANSSVKNDKTVESSIIHVKGLIALNQHDKAAGLGYFAHSLELSKDPEMGLLQTSLLASRGYYYEALTQLETTERLLAEHKLDYSSVLYKHDYPMEIKRLRQQIEQDIKQSSLPAKPKSTGKNIPK